MSTKMAPARQELTVGGVPSLEKISKEFSILLAGLPRDELIKTAIIYSDQRQEELGIENVEDLPPNLILHSIGLNAIKLWAYEKRKVDYSAHKDRLKSRSQPTKRISGALIATVSKIIPTMHNIRGGMIEYKSLKQAEDSSVQIFNQSIDTLNIMRAGFMSRPNIGSSDLKATRILAESLSAEIKVKDGLENYGWEGVRFGTVAEDKKGIDIFVPNPSKNLGPINLQVKSDGTPGASLELMKERFTHWVRVPTNQEEVDPFNLQDEEVERISAFITPSKVRIFGGWIKNLVSTEHITPKKHG